MLMLIGTVVYILGMIVDFLYVWATCDFGEACSFTGFLLFILLALWLIGWLLSLFVGEGGLNFVGAFMMLFTIYATFFMMPDRESTEPNLVTFAYIHEEEMGLDTNFNVDSNPDRDTEFVKSAFNEAYKANLPAYSQIDENKREEAWNNFYDSFKGSHAKDLDPQYHPWPTHLENLTLQQGLDRTAKYKYDKERYY